ncbi:hypothetical protein Tco_0128843 [Tanacetum coccineum]
MDANKKVDLENPLLPWIYLGQFWHTLQEDGSKYKLKFMLDRKELTLTLDDFRSIFYLPQATNNNHDRFVPALKFSEMVPFYKNNLGFTLELRSSSNFKTTGLVQPWQTLCNIFSRCLTTRVTGYDQPPLQIMQMLFLIPEFTKLIVESLNELHPKISRRARNKYHNLEDDEMVKTIFNSGKNKDVVGMKIPDWMITDEMNLTENYRMTTSSPRTPNPEIDEGESSAPQKSTVIRLHTIQLSLAEQKSRAEDEARKNKENVKEHLMAEEIEKLVAKTENVEEHEVDSSILKNDDILNDPSMLEPMSDKESPEVEITAEVQPVNVNEEEEESAEDDYELKRREKGKHVEDYRKLQGCYGYLFEHLTTRFMPIRNFNEIAQRLQDIMIDSLPKMVDDRIKKLLKTQVPLHVTQGLILERQQSQADVAKKDWQMPISA